MHFPLYFTLILLFFLYTHTHICHRTGSMCSSLSFASMFILTCLLLLLLYRYFVGLVFFFFFAKMFSIEKWLNFLYSIQKIVCHACLWSIYTMHFRKRCLNSQDSMSTVWILCIVDVSVWSERIQKWNVHKLAQKTDDNTSETKKRQLRQQQQPMQEQTIEKALLKILRERRRNEIEIEKEKMNKNRLHFVHRILEFIVVLDNAKFSFDTIYSLLLKFDTLSVFS